MEYKELKSVELVKKIKEKTNDCLTILEINEIIKYLDSKHLLTDIQDIIVFNDPNLFIEEGLTEVKTGDNYQLRKELQHQYNLFSFYTIRSIDIIYKSSEIPITISKQNNYRPYNISMAGNAYLNYPEYSKETGNFDMNSNIVTLVSVEKDSKEFSSQITTRSICIYLGGNRKEKDTDTDIAIACLLKILNNKIEK